MDQALDALGAARTTHLPGAGPDGPPPTAPSPAPAGGVVDDGAVGTGARVVIPPLSGLGGGPPALPCGALTAAAGTPPPPRAASSRSSSSGFGARGGAPPHGLPALLRPFGLGPAGVTPLCSLRLATC